MEEKEATTSDSTIDSNTSDNEEPMENVDDSATLSARSNATVTVGKLVLAACFLYSGVNTLWQGKTATVEEPESRRRLTQESSITKTPSYMEPLLADLAERQKLMDETPPEEVKYWFEYTGPLQKYFYRYSKSRGKADYFEGRDDSGVLSARFEREPGGGKDFADFYGASRFSSSERSARSRLLENCLAMGSPARPDTSSGTWKEWFGGASASDVADRCRILVALNTVGAGRGTTMLWETNPPAAHAQGPKPWMSEQETAAMHLERNLKEFDALCATGLAAVRLQVLVCEPIPAKWTEWMDSMLVNCGGKAGPLDFSKTTRVEERPSPVQVVVVASAATADTCHDLKSGFMEKRMQDLLLAPPYMGDGAKGKAISNPAVKTTHPDLFSSDDHDLYVAMKWSSLVSTRAVHSFLQASADVAAAASSPNPPKLESLTDGSTLALTDTPSSPFLIPSFVRVSYVSEENSKVAKWRMHGDFFHPAAWEICKDSYDATWIDDSLSGAGGVNGICYQREYASARAARGKNEPCGQWWVYLAELQMPTSPEVYANEVSPPLVLGGSNYIWMLTERQRREVVKGLVCRHEHGEGKADDVCPELPQAVIPLGDMESFLVNFMTNTALGRKHISGRRPGYSRETEREAERERVRERKQLKGQEDIEKALFDYTIYPAALFRKDASIKAARSRDAVLTTAKDKDAVGPQTVKSSYYDVTITKPRAPVLGWCQAIARRGLCTLYADYFRTSSDVRCREACGMSKNWTPVSSGATSTK